MLRKSKNQKKKSKAKSRKSRKRSQKVTKRKSIRKKSYLPTAAIVIPVVVGTLGLLSAYGYYYELPKYKQQVEKQSNKNIEEIKREIQEKFDVCAICLEVFPPSDTIILKVCGHKFHAKCIQDMQKTKKLYSIDCPLCRKESYTFDYYIRGIQYDGEFSYDQIITKKDIFYQLPIGSDDTRGSKQKEYAYYDSSTDQIYFYMR